ncbi:hypothetical protein pb186bvf_020605 [Paramecium bursaria]
MNLYCILIFLQFLIRYDLFIIYLISINSTSVKYIIYYHIKLGITEIINMIYFIILLSLLLLYLYETKCELRFIKTERNIKIIDNCPTLKKQVFYFTPYLFTGLLQAIFASKKKDVDHKLKFKREYVDFGLDFGYFALDWAQYGQIQNDGPLILMLSGLTASKIEPYIINFTSHLCQCNRWNIVLYNERLYNNREYLDPKRQALPSKGYYHPVEDFRRIVEYLAQKHKKIYAVGHSFGSNTLMRYLGQCGSLNRDSLIYAAVSIANPFDFQLGLKHLEDGISDSYIRQHRQRIILEKIDQYRQPEHIKIDFNKVKQSKTCTQFDQSFTIKIFNAPAKDYHYLSLNCVNMLDYVKVPTLFIQSWDDPVINYKQIYPYEVFNRNKNFISFFTRIGGHIAWFQGVFDPQRWYHKPSMNFSNQLGKKKLLMIVIKHQ